jgi:hypothetical protein
MWTELLSCLLSFGFWSFVIFTDETEDGQAKAWQAHEEVEDDREIVGSVCDQREQKVETDAEHIYHLQKNKIGLLQHIQTIWNIKKHKNAKKSMPKKLTWSKDPATISSDTGCPSSQPNSKRSGVQVFKLERQTT